MLLAAILLGVAVIPVAASDSDAAMIRPTRLVVAFHEYPAWLSEGARYDDEVIVRAIPEIGVIAVKTFDPAGFAARQRADPNVKYVKNDDPVPLLLEREPLPAMPLSTPDDPQYSSMYGPQQVRANLAWDTTLGDMDAAVCIIDTGVRRTHEDLGTARYLGGYDYVNGDSDPSDDQGHGTHVAGSAVGAINNGKGVSGMGNTGYYAVKVLDSAGSGAFSDVAAGITWCANNGMARTVLSMSLGCVCSDATISSAIHYAFATKGMLVAAASGNGYCSNCVGFPGNHPEAIGVACTTSSVASCSFTSKGPEVDIAAPGENILSTCYTSDTAYCTKSGTSMSTPHASGVLALVWSHETTLTAAQLWQRLNDTAKDVGDAGKDSTFGWGRIDAQCLITNTLCSLPPPPPPPTNDIFTELFETGATDWTLTGLWHASACRAKEGASSLAYNKVGACPQTYDTGATNSGEATSPAIEIPGEATYVRLRMASWYSTESSTSYDKKTVLVSANDGPFTQVHQESSGASAWKDLDLDISSFAGQSIRVKLRFDTVDSISNAYEGWYVDALKVAADVELGPPGVPGVPLLTATAGPAAGGIQLAWSKPSQSGSNITLYHVYGADDASGPFVLLGSPTERAYDDTGLANGATRHYKVSAENGIGEGPLSATASATTFNVPGAPVVSVAAGPGVGQLTASWSAPPANGLPITGYTVLQSTSASGPFSVAGTTTGASFTESGLGNGVMRFYKVFATNGLGEGPSSGAASGTTFQVPGAPATLAAASGNAQLTLTWTAGADGGTPITGYRVYRASNASGPYTLRANASGTTFTDTGLSEGTRYWYRVSARNLVGEGPQSIDANARTFSRPSAPRDLTARPGGQLFSIDLGWTAPADNGGTAFSLYYIYRDGLYVGAVSGTTFRDRNLDPTVVYHYQVSATNVVGEGPKSDEACSRPYPYPTPGNPAVPSCEILGIGLSASFPAAPDRRTETE